LISLKRFIFILSQNVWSVFTRKKALKQKQASNETNSLKLISVFFLKRKIRPNCVEQLFDLFLN